jgi:glycosyltransferase involved in cell wall biosynthesis
MRVLVDSIPMTGLLTGIARYLRNLYTAMESLDGIETSYFNGKAVAGVMPPLADSQSWQQKTQYARKLPPPLVFAIRSARWLRYEYYLTKACRVSKPAFDLYHETAFTPAKLTGVPTIFSVYDLSLRRYRETHPKERVWMFEYFIKTRLCYASHILTISDFIRREIIDEFNISPSMVSSVPLAPDPQFVPCDENHLMQTKQKYNLPESYLLFVSSLEPRKNIDVLVQALLAADTDIPLVMVGWQGWGEKRWLDLIDRNHLADRIILTGHVPDHDLKAFYTGARAMIYPSLYEGFGLPIIEAMACNCPVICSNAASMPEVAGEAAMFIDPAGSDELARCIEILVYDTKIHNEFVEKGRRRAACFSWEKTAKQTLDVFKKVAG